MTSKQTERAERFVRSAEQFCEVVEELQELTENLLLSATEGEQLSIEQRKEVVKTIKVMKAQNRAFEKIYKICVDGASCSHNSALEHDEVKREIEKIRTDLAEMREVKTLIKYRKPILWAILVLAALAFIVAPKIAKL
ncbi:hypothetical protein KAR91_54570 [Candidatus Pacearchaeota archaeon]|nr:hypothetical protein [Candidatus Pacearchaeota archaeon]